MLEALLFGVIASSALVIGGAVGAFWRAPEHVTGALLAFASGALLAALSFELFPQAAELGGHWYAGAGLLAGAAVFVLAHVLLDRYVSDVGGAAKGETTAASSTGAGLALVAAVTLDGIPENTALGVSLAGDTSFVLLLAIFASNLPESLAGAIEMRDGGRSPTFAVGIWSVTAVLLALAVVAGAGLAGGLEDEPLALLLAFAGGAVLASLADTLMPEAFVKGQPVNAFATVAGFFVSFVLAH